MLLACCIRTFLSRDTLCFLYSVQQSCTGARVTLLLQWLGYGLDHPGFKSRQKKLSCPPIGQTGPVAHPTSCLLGIGVHFPGRKGMGREVDQPSPSSAGAKNQWSCTSTSSACHVVYRDNFAYFLNSTQILLWDKDKSTSVVLIVINVSYSHYFLTLPYSCRNFWTYFRTNVPTFPKSLVSQNQHLDFQNT